jgi:hypothetical protein
MAENGHCGDLLTWRPVRTARCSPPSKRLSVRSPEPCYRVRMTLPEIGTPAPSFRLPSAAGTEVALGDYRGVKSVVLWFSKGLF